MCPTPLPPPHHIVRVKIILSCLERYSNALKISLCLFPGFISAQSCNVETTSIDENLAQTLPCELFSCIRIWLTAVTPSGSSSSITPFPLYRAVSPLSIAVLEEDVQGGGGGAQPSPRSESRLGERRWATPARSDRGQGRGGGRCHLLAPAPFIPSTASWSKAGVLLLQLEDGCQTGRAGGRAAGQLRGGGRGRGAAPRGR